MHVRRYIVERPDVRLVGLAFVPQLQPGELLDADTRGTVQLVTRADPAGEWDSTTLIPDRVRYAGWCELVAREGFVHEDVS